MTHERLTRHEISWLLAQEARGAAKTLRDEVRGDTAEPLKGDAKQQPVETTLDALDDAIEMLSALNTTGQRGKARRGRIDVAALLYEVAPNARISIEPGAGTEVLGDESDLRRMLSVLVTHASSAGADEMEVQVRREGDWIKISVELGPDTAAAGELERRWLARMATRHGGHVELEGGTQSVFLQADGASDQREVTELRRELVQAQQLGEAYARELATMLARGELRSEPPPPRATADGAQRLVVLRSVCRALERTVRASAEAIRHDAAAAQRIDAAHELAQSLSRRGHLLGEAASELTAVAECPLDEPSVELDLTAEFESARQTAATRAAREGVTLVVDVATGSALRGPRALFHVLLRALLSEAIAATPRGGQAHIAATRTQLGLLITVRDGGPSVPEGIAEGLIQHDVDPTSMGRPGGIALLTADAAARALGGELSLRAGALGATETWVTLPGS